MKNFKKVNLLILILLLAVMVGCSSNMAQEEPNNPDTVVVKDSIVLALTADVASLDSHFSTAAIDGYVFENICEPLVTVTKQGEFIPNLSKEWSISDDALVYTFKLEENVMFHNGEIFNANDVVFSYNRAKESPALGRGLSLLDKIVALDDQTVEMTLTSPNATFMLSVSGVTILNEKAVTEAGETYSENPVGTGPYKFVKQDIGERVVLERFDDYFKGATAIKDVEFKVITDLNTTLIALENEEIDFAYKIPAISYQDAIDNPELNVYETSSGNLNYIVMNLNVAPFDNVLVRQAFNLAIDKSTIVDIVLEGAGEVTEGIFNDTTFGYSENVTGYEYDPQKAKELLVSAGYPDGFDVKLGTLAGSMEMTSQILQQNLKEIGINVEIEVFEQSSFIQDVMSGNFTMATFSITLLADADFYSMCFHSNSVDGGLNVSNYSNDKVDELFDAAKEIIDPATRIEIYEQVAQIISDDAVIIPVYFPTKMYPTNSNLIIEDVEKFGVSKLDKMHWK